MKVNIYDEYNKKIIARVILKNNIYIEERITYRDDNIREKDIFKFDNYGNLIDKEKIYA